MKLKTFKTLQYNITHILHINSSTIIFCVIHNFTFLMIDTKIKEQVSFESWEKKKLLVAQSSVKCIMLPVQSITLANWFVCIPACTSRIMRVSLTSLYKPLASQNFFSELIGGQDHGQLLKFAKVTCGFNMNFSNV